MSSWWTQFNSIQASIFRCVPDPISFLLCKNIAPTCLSSLPASSVISPSLHNPLHQHRTWGYFLHIETNKHKQANKHTFLDLCIRHILQGIRIHRMYIYRTIFIIRNWLTWLWMLTSPKICRGSLQAGDAESMVSFQFQRSAAWDPGRANVFIQVLKQEKVNAPGQRLADSKHGQLLRGRSIFWSILVHTFSCWIRPIHIRDSNLLNSLSWFKC